ncbi:MAG: hypothetical protein P8M11_14625 [Planctomycetota bacterium]|nr:hypothetical protein [Planctomycetota bacterium]MDG1985790.1 hypothetical protein [Planctomycetota bacterium]
MGRRLPQLPPPLLLLRDLGVAATLGVASCGEPDDPAPSSSAGFWFAERGAETRDAIGSLGYAAGYEPAAGRWTGLRVHDPESAYLEPLLFSSGHEAAAYLLLPDGTIERRWALSEASNQREVGPRIQHPTQRAWRRIQELPDGDLLVIHEGLCVMRLAPNSTIRWRAAPGAHHDFLVEGDSAWVLDRTVTPLTTSEREWLGGLEAQVARDGLVRISLEDGRALERASLTELEGGEDWTRTYRDALRRARSVDIGDARPGGALHQALDPLHSNALVRLHPERRVPSVFLREAGALVDVAPGLSSIERLRAGPFIGAHDPQLDPLSGGVLLFDNFGDSGVGSRVLALDVGLQAAELVFQGSAEAPFFSPVCGTVLPLPGDRLLVIESTAGRALQIDREGRILWEFRTPFRLPEEDLVAVLLDMRPRGKAGEAQPADR